MAAVGNITALRADTFKNLQLNAGILMKDVSYSSITDATALKTAIANVVSGGSSPIGTLLGATRGGGTFTVTRETRKHRWSACYRNRYHKRKENNGHDVHGDLYQRLSDQHLLGR